VPVSGGATIETAMVGEVWSDRKKRLAQDYAGAAGRRPV